jgi:hypothetical protein
MDDSSRDQFDLTVDPVEIIERGCRHEGVSVSEMTQ